MEMQEKETPMEYISRNKQHRAHLPFGFGAHGEMLPARNAGDECSELLEAGRS